MLAGDRGDDADRAVYHANAFEASASTESRRASASARSARSRSQRVLTARESTGSQPSMGTTTRRSGPANDAKCRALNVSSVSAPASRAQAAMRAS